MPTLSPIAGGTTFNTGFSNNATTGIGYGKTGTGWVNGAGTPVSEMGYMYYANLGNLGFCTPDNVSPGSCAAQAGFGLQHTGLFSNLQCNNYWSGLEFAPDPASAWGFGFGGGGQGAGGKNGYFFAWAVRSGDVAASSVPEPGTIILLGLGLVGIGFNKRSKRRL